MKRGHLLWFAAVAYGALLVFGSLSGFPSESPTGAAMPYLSDKPIGEDGYYMLTIAWQLGNGHGLSYNSDGVTTGIQPLSTFLYAGVAWLVQAAGGDRWTFARAMLGVGIFEWLLVALVIVRLTRRWQPAEVGGVAPDSLAVVLALANYTLFRICTYGLETPIYLALAGWFVLRSSVPPSSLRNGLMLGAIAGMTTLARIDFVVPLTVFLAVEVWRARLRWPTAAAVVAAAGAVAAPWFAFVFAATGSPIPSSGHAQMGWVMDPAVAVQRVREMSLAVAQHLSPWLHLAAPVELLGALSPTLAGWVVALGAGVAGAWVMRHGWHARESHRSESLRSWWPSLTVLVLVYVVAFRPTFFYLRYTAPLLLFTLPLLAIGLARLLSHRRWYSAVQVAAIASFSIVAWLTLHSGRLGNPHSIPAGYVHRLLPPPAVVGAFQSGTIGYFNPNVVNLDGKVNAAVLSAQRTGTFADYVRQRGITHVVDWDTYLVTAPFDAWPECDTGRFGSSTCKKSGTPPAAVR
ncbi:MAG TPA: hypothetical protein VEA16_08445 [Vicinamibacterales bacterium]|nr:hypothetical protein [Vicinamibacterales bacterium]